MAMAEPPGHASGCAPGRFIPGGPGLSLNQHVRSIGSAPPLTASYPAVRFSIAGNSFSMAAFLARAFLLASFLGMVASQCTDAEMCVR